MKIYPFRASYPNAELISSADSFFSSVSKEYINFKNAGFFKDSKRKSLYIYRIEGVNIYTGIIAANDISDLEQNKILGHENTITEKEQAMLSLMMLRKSMIKPVLLAHIPSQEIDDFKRKYISENKAAYFFKLSNPAERHTFWAIDNKDDINQVKSLFKKNISKAYIADGHHRASITARLVRSNYLHDQDDHSHPGLLCAFFPFTDLTIYDFNRVITLPVQMSSIRFMAQLSEYCNIMVSSKALKPVAKNQLTLFLNQEWFILEWKQVILDQYKDRTVVLDVDLFNDCILKNILEISDIKSATEIKYVEGVSGLESLMYAARSPGSAAFCLFPVAKEDVIRISDEGEVLPPKSTWFEPRMKNGMIIKEF